MAKHKHGSMDTTQHERTFNGFVKISAWVVVHIFVILILLALFAT